MNVVVFETFLTGHRAYYVKVLAEELVKLGLNIRLAIPAPESWLEEGHAFLSDVVKQCDVIPVHTPCGSAWQIARKQLWELADVVRKSGADHAFVPYADGIAQVWGAKLLPKRFLSIDPQFEIEGLMMRGSFAYPAQNLKQCVARKINLKVVERSAWTCLHHLDPLAYQAIQNQSPKLANRTRLIPEAIEPLSINDFAEARKVLDVRSESQLITCPGTIHERKGVDLLIEAFSKNADIQNAQLLLWGKHSIHIKRLLQGKYQWLVEQQRIISRDCFASPLEFDSLFVAANLVAVAYPRHVGSSSILIRAAHAGVNVIASNWGWVGWATEKFQLGKTCDVTDPASFAKLMRHELTHTRGPQSDSRRKQFVSYHSLENHLAHWTHRICARLKIPDSRSKIEPTAFTCEN